MVVHAEGQRLFCPGAQQRARTMLDALSCHSTPAWSVSCHTLQPAGAWDPWLRSAENAVVVTEVF